MPQLTKAGGAGGLVKLFNDALEAYRKEAAAKAVAWLHDPGRAWGQVQTKRPLAVLFYAPSGDKPGIGPADPVWADAALRDKVAKDFVPLACADEAFEGVKVAERPALVFFGPDRKEFNRAAKLGATAAEVAKAFDGAMEAIVAVEQAAQAEDFKKDLAKPDEADKLKALDTIGKSKNGKAYPLLKDALKSDRFKVRAAAAKALGEIKAVDAIPALGDILKNKAEVGDVQVEAAGALGAIGDARAVPVLMLDLMMTKDEKAYFARIDALGLIKDRTSIEALLEIPGKIRGKPIKETNQHCQRLLEALTREKQPNINAWRTWWSKVKDTFQFAKD